MYDILLAGITAFLVTYIAIPPIIRIAKKKKLFDLPDERKSHNSNTPALGGLAIFAGVIFSLSFWTPFTVFGELQYILSAFIIIFLIGAKDDIDPVSPTTKLIAEVLAAAILVMKSNVVITSMHGLFGIYEIQPIFAIILSIVTIVVIVNSFNLIDGINGLGASITILAATAMGSWFFLVNKIELSILAFALTGSVLAFLRFNVTPAKIFMGDAGSLFCGLVVAIMTIKFIEYQQVLVDSPYSFKAVPAVAMGILILPLFDTLRVFTMRVLKGKSPLSPDRSHIHHILIDAGLSHMQATGTLVMVNLAFMIVVFKLQYVGTANLLIVITSLALALSVLLYFVAQARAEYKNTHTS
jgi:UDP-N-acetylmuramyl pentapeptide phosphotransferase/UDP-N-acetylglucosamine-1-phosphate transferase